MESHEDVYNRKKKRVALIEDSDDDFSTEGKRLTKKRKVEVAEVSTTSTKKRKFVIPKKKEKDKKENTETKKVRKPRKKGTETPSAEPDESEENVVKRPVGRPKVKDEASSSKLKKTAASCEKVSKKKSAEDHGQKEKVFSGQGVEWEARIMCEKMNALSMDVAKYLAAMFRNQYTVAFIARYRKEMVNDLNADQIRKAKEYYNDARALEEKVKSLIQKLSKAEKLTPTLTTSINAVKTMEDLSYIAEPFKGEGRKTKADQARELGLEEAALNLLNGSTKVRLDQLTNNRVEGLKTFLEVSTGIKYILADIYSKDPDVLEQIRKLQKEVRIMLMSDKNTNKTSKKQENPKSNSNEKFENYYHFQKNVQTMEAHQVLAINRGEDLGALTVRVEIDNRFRIQLRDFCRNKWFSCGMQYELREDFFKDSFEDSYKRLIVPFVTRRVRSNLKHEAERKAFNVFMVNLKSLFMMQPCKGESILGIDPGFNHGCKMALIKSNGEVAWTKTLYFVGNWNEDFAPSDALELKCQMVKHECQTIALGNGKGCRMMEDYINRSVKSNFFNPLDVKYTIVNERGASIYSCTKEAAEEFPNLDPNLISAVHIARTLQDPLSEYIKVEPKHLGVGMYQHDLSEKNLENSLNCVVTECVSFTGVDVNTASLSLLRRVSGLNVSTAKNILEWREKNGPIINRKQLRTVKGIGPKIYEQAAGFLRINPKSITRLQDGSLPDEIEMLDQTWIHPESYDIAKRLMKMWKLNSSEIGKENFVKRVTNKLEKLKGDVSELAGKLNTSVQTTRLIVMSLSLTEDYDIRIENSKPLFKINVKEFGDLKTGGIVHGYVTNVTTFGAFVDIGVCKDGLLHKSEMKGIKLKIGNKVKLRIKFLDAGRQRIQFEFISTIDEGKESVL